MSIIDNQHGVQFLLETLRQNGVACASVADGHVILLKTNILQDLLDQVKNSAKDYVVLFVKKDQVEKGEEN